MPASHHSKFLQADFLPDAKNNSIKALKTSGQTNLTKGRIAAAHGPLLPLSKLTLPMGDLDPI